MVDLSINSSEAISQEDYQSHEFFHNNDKKCLNNCRNCRNSVEI